MSTPVFRFAPSPNGWLHLGHAASALLNQKLARETQGRFLLRIEDIDITRCRPAFENGIFEDLAWLDFAWETPVLRQSERFACYGAALDRLQARGLLYPCFCSRKRMALDGATGASDPDGAPRYSGRCRNLSASEGAARMTAEPYALRLRMDEALAQTGHALFWHESLPGGASASIPADAAAWGDVVVRRKEFPASYHLAVVVDDAAQGVTHVVRGRDLFAATGVHRLLQVLLGLPEPQYFHHGLIAGDDGRKLSKSLGSTALRDLRAQGISPDEIRRMLDGFLALI